MATIVQPPQQYLRECVLRNGKKIAGSSPHCVARDSRTRVLARTAVLDLPEELLEAILPYLHIKDLCALSQVCSRLNALAEAPKRWMMLCAERWGPLSELHHEAKEEAGSWKRLFHSKNDTDKNAEQMQKLCPYELRAAVRRIAACCSSRSSVCFCLDGSGSVTSEDFQVMTGFVSTTMEAVMLRGVDCKVGVVQFSNDVRVEIHPQSMSPEDLKGRLDELSRMNGGTNIALSIKQAGQLLRGEERETARIVVLLTDGRVDSFQGREAVKMAERLADEQANVSIFALGVGRGVEKTELERIIAVCGADKVSTRYIPLCTLDEAPW